MGNEHSSADISEAAEALEHHSGDEHYEEEHFEEQAEEEVAADADSNEFFGFRVLGIQEESPASRVGFVSFFDFILSANGIRLDSRDSTFMELIAQSEEQPMELEVYNIKSQTIRELILKPSRRWAGKGLLGVTIRFDSYEHAEDQLVHVLNVAKNSPAANAGLCPGSDYLLGTPERVFRDAEDLNEEILEAIDGHFQAYVYNAEIDQVRIVRIEPNDKWGGDGFLGAEVGHGVLHRLPFDCRATNGTSMGFVSLSDEAAAATDPYLRQFWERVERTPAPHIEQDAPPSDGQQDNLVEENTESISDRAESSATAAVDTEEPSPESAPAPTTASSESAMTPTLVDEPVAPAPSPPPPSKLRYAARIDPMFPISTIEVLADPTHLN